MAPPHTNHWSSDPQYNDLLNYLIEKAKNAKSPINIQPLAREVKEKSGAVQTVSSFEKRIYRLRTRIHTFAHIDTNTKVKLLFTLSASVNANFLEKLKKDAVVEVDGKKRITHYKANDGILELKGDHSRSAKTKTGKLESKQSLLSWIINYFETKDDADAIPKTEKEKEMGNLIEFISEKCVNVDIPQSIDQLAKDFINRFGISKPTYCIRQRVEGYGREIQKVELLDTLTKVKQLFCLSASVDSGYLEKLRKDAVVDVDNRNRITKYTANDGHLTLHGDHSLSAKARLAVIEGRKRKKTVRKHSNSGGDEDEDSEKENGYSEDDSDEYSSEEFGSEFDSDEENDLDETEDHMESSAVDFDEDTPVRNRSPTGMSFDDNFDFDLPTERSNASEETETREDDEKDDVEITENAAVETQRSETLPKSKNSSSTSHTPKTPKRKVDASAGSSSTKRTKPPSDESTNPEGMNDNCSHDDPPRIELKPFRGLLGLPKETQKDSDIQQIPKSRPQVMEAPIKKEYEEEAHTSLRMVLNAFKSLILSLETPGLSELQMELDKKIMEAGRRIEISNKEVILAMELLIVKLTKIGVTESPEDSISLREILSILRTIILTLNFNGFEVILEMLKVNIEQLKVQDKKIRVSKLECVLRAILDIICT